MSKHIGSYHVRNETVRTGRKQRPAKPKISIILCGTEAHRQEQQDYMMRRFHETVHNTIQNKIENRLPIARYDADKDLAYIEYPDGTRKYAEKT